jgi:response regulator RpfG family c-di-GMP phosphodiesterase
VKQCSVLIVNCDHRETAHRQALESRGFLVVETREWPDDGVVHAYEVVIVVLRHVESMGMLAARMRAKPRFGHRVLIGISPGTPTSDDRRNAIAAGFDDVIGESGDSRTLIARILQRLRARPEHRCLLPDRKRSAA